ncbi:hypothetical protein KAJ38_02705 [Candidatus Pacearchaeota archaeon]|nr:hypothetical protein [Candidatus Pacearchaeota archaeon]
MKTEFRVFGKKGVASFQIMLMLASLFAFSYIMYSATFVASAGETAEITSSILSPEGNVYPGPMQTVPIASADYYTTSAAKISNLNTPAVTETGGSSWISNTVGGENLVKGGGMDSFLTGLQWAVVAYGAGQMLGSMLGMTDKNTKALSTAMSLGVGAYNILETYTSFTEGSIFQWLGANPALSGVVIGAIVFAAMYKKESTKTVEFNCMPWQAPTGGDACEECNDPNLPCSEYRCKSLGQNCELVNKGTDQERCITVRHDDTNPPIISPDRNKLTYDHEYINVKNSPPGPGFNIVYTNSNDGCLKAFTPLEFGVNTDEPAQCKIDFNHTLRFEDMVSFMGGNNLYLYNHSERFSLPGAKDIENSSFPLENGKDITFFIRCRDKQGNENSAEYAVKFCIDPTPDNTAPQIKATSIINGGCVAEEQSNAAVEFYTNEPADCRWSSQNQDYDNMQNEMICSSELYQINAAQLFTCKANLTGIVRDETNFYVRCKDQPGKTEEDRNENKESYLFSLRGSTGLKMKNLQPNNTIFGAARPSPVELYVETLFGCNNGRAVCFYSLTDKDDDYIMFYDTNTEDGIHTQRLDLDAGKHEYYIKCVDGGGNVVEDIMEFSLDIDESAPVVARVYEEDQMLKIVTVRDSECVYSLDNCDFSFDEGTQMPYANSTVHVAEWVQGKTYYIKCRDEFKNEDADCSVVVRLSQNFL